MDLTFIISFQLRIPFNVAVRPRDLCVIIGKKHIKAGIRNQTPVIDDDFEFEVKTDECSWVIQDSRILVISLEKVFLKFSIIKYSFFVIIILQFRPQINKMNWWSKLVLSDPVISTKKINPGKKNFI